MKNFKFFLFYIFFFPLSFTLKGAVTGEACSDLITYLNKKDAAKISPEIVTDQEDPCYVDYGSWAIDDGKESEAVIRLKKVRHFFADLIEYQVSQKDDPVASKKRVMQVHKETVLNLFKYKNLFAKATADLKALALDATKSDSVQNLIYKSLQKEIKKLEKENSGDVAFLKALAPKELESFLDSDNLLEFLSGVGAFVDKSYKDAESSGGDETYEFFTKYEKEIEKLYDEVFLGLSSGESSDDPQSQVARLRKEIKTIEASKSPMDGAYRAISQLIDDKIGGVDVSAIVKENLDKLEDGLFPKVKNSKTGKYESSKPKPGTDYKTLDGETRLKLFALDLLESRYFQAMGVEEKKRLFASILRQTLSISNPDGVVHLMTGLVNGSGTFMQKLLQKVVGLMDDGSSGSELKKRSDMTQADLVKAKDQCLASALQGAKSKLGKNPEFATLYNFSDIEAHGDEVLSYAYIGRASVGVAMMIDYKSKGSSESTCIAYKELRYKAKSRFLAEYNIVKDLAEDPKHDVAGFIIGIGDRIQEEMNLGGEKGEIENLKLAHEKYYLSSYDVNHNFGDGDEDASRIETVLYKKSIHPEHVHGSRDFNATIVPVDMIEGFPRNKEYMAMALAPGSEFSDIVDDYKDAVKESSNLKELLEFIGKAKKIDDYDLIDLRIDVYAQMYLVRQLVSMWINKIFFAPSGERGMFHSDLHEGNMFMSIKTRAIRELLDEGSITYDRIEKFATRLRDNPEEEATINLTMIDFGAWEVLEKTTSNGMLNLVISALIGSPKGFFQSLDEIGKQFSSNILDEKMPVDTPPSPDVMQGIVKDIMDEHKTWEKVTNAERFRIEAEKAITEITDEKGQKQGAEEKLTKLIIVKMMMENNVIPPKQVTAFLEGFLVVTNSTTGFKKAVEGMNRLGAGIEGIQKADAMEIIAGRMQQALVDDLLEEELKKLGDGSIESFQTVVAGLVDVFNPVMLAVNATTKGKSLLVLKRLMNGKSRMFVNQGNREVAIGKIGFKLIESIKFREFRTMTCAEGEVYDGGLCYKPCKEGFKGVGPICWPSCPEKFKDIGISCAKPAAYGRGVGYPWKAGDKAFSLDGARDRCLNDNKDLGCEKTGAIIYPKCKEGFKNFGSNICTPLCPSDAGGPMRDDGAFCRKNEYSRGVGKVIYSCDLLNEEVEKANGVKKDLYLKTYARDLDKLDSHARIEKEKRDLEMMLDKNHFTKIRGFCYASCNSKRYKRGYKKALKKNYKANDWPYTKTVHKANLINLDIFCAQVPERIIDVLEVHVEDDAKYKYELSDNE